MSSCRAHQNLKRKKKNKSRGSSKRNYLLKVEEKNCFRWYSYDFSIKANYNFFNSWSQNWPLRFLKCVSFWSLTFCEWCILKFYNTSIFFNIICFFFVWLFSALYNCLLNFSSSFFLQIIFKIHSTFNIIWNSRIGNCDQAGDLSTSIFVHNTSGWSFFLYYTAFFLF